MVIILVYREMKMFAMETGEDGTPRDKVKISRAQREIDNIGNPSVVPTLNSNNHHHHHNHHSNNNNNNNNNNNSNSGSGSNNPNNNNSNGSNMNNNSNRQQ